MYEDMTAIGEILLRRGCITKKQLARVLVEQSKRQAASIGDLLIELKICDEDDVLSALREQEMARVPKETLSKTKEAKETLAAAFAKMQYEFARLEKRNQPDAVMCLKISGED